MKYNELVISKHKTARRVGRGISGGRGKTAGRGTKGQGSRKSSGIRAGFEGGQLPLYMRLPHLRGFKSHKPAVEIVYTAQLEIIRKTTIDNQALFEAGLIKNLYSIVKLLSKGDLSSKKEVKLQYASKKAVEMLQKSGGTFTSVPRPARPKAKTKV